MTAPPEQVRVLAEHRGVVAVYKPAALATEPTDRPEPSLVERVAELVGSRRVRAASRLDVGVSGVVLCTTDRAAARWVDRCRRRHGIVRHYVALAAGQLPPRGSWNQPLGRQRNGSGRIRVSSRAAQTRHARTDYLVVASVSKPNVGSLVVLRPHTGRMHQLRVHAAEAGAPLWGDRRYGGASTIVTTDGRVVAVVRIGLHAAHVSLDEDVLCATAPVPEALQDLWRHLGGNSDDWRRAARRFTAR